LADDAQRLAALENLLSLLPAMGQAGILGKKAPTAAIIDSQSVRTASQPGVRGDDAGKKITGRKRHILVDTQGNILALKVTTADVQDRDGAKLLLNTACHL
jgi:putative transposase